MGRQQTRLQKQITKQQDKNATGHVRFLLL